MIEWSCEFSSSPEGFYILPLIALGWEPNRFSLHLGWGPWLFSIYREELP